MRSTIGGRDKDGFHISAPGAPLSVRAPYHLAPQRDLDDRAAYLQP